MDKVTVTIEWQFEDRPSRHRVKSLEMVNGWGEATAYRLLIDMAMTCINYHINNFIGHNRIASIERKFLDPLIHLQARYTPGSGEDDGQGLSNLNG